MGSRRIEAGDKKASNITAFKADSEFLGAEDIMGRGPIEIRVGDILTYPAGYVVAGRPMVTSFPVMVYARRDGRGEWRTGKKRWIISGVEVRQSLIIRAESVHAADWRGMVIMLHVEPCKSPKGRGAMTWGIRVTSNADERNHRTLREKMQRAAQRLPPEERDPRVSNILEAAAAVAKLAPEPPPEQPPPREDEDTTEPPGSD